MKKLFNLFLFTIISTCILQAQDANIPVPSKVVKEKTATNPVTQEPSTVQRSSAIDDSRLVVDGTGSVFNAYEGVTTSFHTSNQGNSVYAESNSVGDATGSSGTVYARSMMSGYNTNPLGLMNTGLWGNVTGQGAGGYGVIASYGTDYISPTTYVALAGSGYAGLFMGGDVGIRTTTPESSLHVASGADASYTNDGYFMTGSKTGLNIIQDNNEIMARNNGAAADLFVQNDGGDFRIGNASTTTKVGVGNVNPITEFHMVHAPGFGSHGMTIQSTSAGAGHWTIYADASTVNKRLYFLPDGTSSPDAHIEFGTGNWVPTSDARKKKNIEPVVNMMSSIMLLNPTKYHMTEQETTEQKTYGLLAQEVLEVFPGVVNYIKESDQYGLSYTELIPIMIAGMQEQNVTIQNYETEVESLKSELELMREEIEAIKEALKD